MACAALFTMAPIRTPAWDGFPPACPPLPRHAPASGLRRPLLRRLLLQLLVGGLPVDDALVVSFEDRFPDDLGPLLRGKGGEPAPRREDEGALHDGGRPLRILPSRRGPISETVARTGCPCSPKRSQKVTGYPSYANGASPSFATRSTTFGLSPPARGIPERSPFTSARKTGTPIALNRSASTRSVTVFPVPVAPAISPCRFAIPGSRAISFFPFAIGSGPGASRIFLVFPRGFRAGKVPRPPPPFYRIPCAAARAAA